MYFATGEWGRFAQYATGFALLVALVLIAISFWIKKDNPRKAQKLKKMGVWLIGLIPIVYLVVGLVAVLLFVAVWKF